MTRYKCTVAYEGAAYCGWQSQKNGGSIQEEIEGALFHISGERIGIVASGRTDKGVNALGQVFHFDSDQQRPARRWQGAMNALLPEDIRILAVEEAGPYFHARCNARCKQYDYCIHLGQPDVFSRRYAYQCPFPIDIGRMEKGAACLKGTHDFSSFCANSRAETPDQVRTLYEISFHQEGQMLRISYIGSGFLRHMVRMMTGMLLEVGRGRFEPEEVAAVLAAKSKQAVRENAPAQGLTLVRVEYDRVLFRSRDLTVRELSESCPQLFSRYRSYPQEKYVLLRPEGAAFGVILVEDCIARVDWLDPMQKDRFLLAEKEIAACFQREGKELETA